MAASSGCIGVGGIIAIIFGTFLGTLVIVSVILLAAWWRFKNKREQHEKIIVLEKAAATGYEKSAFKNDTSSTSHTNHILSETETLPALVHPDSPKKKTSIFEKLLPKRSTVSGNVASTESLGQIISVSLKSKDVNGLGFTIHGNMTDGIFVKDMKSGAAAECGSILVGDRLLSITIDFEKMVFEDALTILSYASPYPVSMELQRLQETRSHNIELKQPKTANVLLHPLFKSQSIGNLTSHLAQNGNAGWHLDAGRSHSVKITDHHVLTPTAAVVNAQSEPFVPPIELRQLSRLEAIEESPTISTRSDVAVVAAIEIEHPVTDAFGSANDDDDDPYKDLSAEEKLELMRLSYEEPCLTQSTPNIFAAVGDHHSPLVRTTAAAPPQQPRLTDDDIISDGESIPDLETAKAMLEARKAQMVNEVESPGSWRSSPTKVEIDASQLYLTQKSRLKPVNNNNHDFTVAARTYSAPNQFQSDALVMANGESETSANGNSFMHESDVEQRKKLLFFQQQLAQQQEDLAKMGIHIHTPTNQNGDRNIKL